MEQGSMRTPIFFSPPGGCYVDEDIDLFLSPRWMLRIAYTYGIVRYTSPLVGRGPTHPDADDDKSC